MAIEFSNGINAQSALAGAGVLGGAGGLGYTAMNYKNQSGLTTAAEATAAAGLVGGGAYLLHGQHKTGKEEHEAAVQAGIGDSLAKSGSKSHGLMGPHLVR